MPPRSFPFRGTISELSVQPIPANNPGYTNQLQVLHPQAPPFSFASGEGLRVQEAADLPVCAARNGFRVRIDFSNSGDTSLRAGGYLFAKTEDREPEAGPARNPLRHYALYIKRNSTIAVLYYSVNDRQRQVR